MAKFCGEIGYIKNVETSPGVWSSEETVKHFTGDINRNSKRWQVGESKNDNINISNEISILADNFAISNIGSMRWISINGEKWKILNAELSYPRIILTAGDVYNG